jgi:hypothetical protein
VTNHLKTLLDSYHLATKRRSPRGQILVHNRSTLRTEPGTRGFRARWSKPAPEFILSIADGPDLGEHRRVERAGPLLRRRRRTGVRPAMTMIGSQTGFEPATQTSKPACLNSGPTELRAPKPRLWSIAGIGGWPPVAT